MDLYLKWAIKENLVEKRKRSIKMLVSFIETYSLEMKNVCQE